MRSRTISILALLVALALPGCLPQTEEPPTAPPAATTRPTDTSVSVAPINVFATDTPAPLGPINPATLVIRYRKHHWGAGSVAPSVTVWGDGQAFYSLQGGNFTTEEVRLSEAMMRLLVEAVERAEFFTLADFYNHDDCALHQSYISLSISANGQTKHVGHSLGDCTAPDQLKRLEADLEQLLQIEQHTRELRPTDKESAAKTARRITWFIGLSMGGSLEQVEKEQEVVDEFNSSNQNDIPLVLNVLPNAEAFNVLATQIAAGTPPDIIGPVGIRGITNFQKHLLPLDDLIAKHGVDLSVYEPRVLDAYRNEQGQLIALPYMVFPSFVYVNKDLFDAANVPYPPQKFGELYEGKPWDMDALRDLAMRLTLDASGKNATEEGFDPTRIVQFGFNPQWNDSAISEGAFFGAGDLTGPNNEATIPAAWQEAWRWFYNARHVDRFVPDSTYANSTAFGEGNVWKEGKVAMAWAHLWLTCCFEAKDVPRWDLAVVPAYNGATTAKIQAESFAIIHKHNRGERELDAIFTAYLFLLRSPELSALYGGFPAVTAEQPAFFTTLDRKYAPNQVNWQVALDSMAHHDMPSHEQHVPNYLKFWDRYAAFDQLRHTDASLDLDAEIEKLEQDLTAIFQGN